MEAAQYDFDVAPGASTTIRFRVMQNKTDPVDLSGWTARSQVRETVRSPDALFELNTENGGIEIDGPNGYVSLIYTGDNTAKIKQPAKSDVFLYPPEGGMSLRPMQMTISPIPVVTRA